MSNRVANALEEARQNDFIKEADPVGDMLNFSEELHAQMLGLVDIALADKKFTEEEADSLKDLLGNTHRVFNKQPTHIKLVVADLLQQLQTMRHKAVTPHISREQLVPYIESEARIGND